jgi:Flp pilus assembly protein TadG
MRGGAERERGALLLSYVIIVPVFLLMIMFIVQASMWFLARSAALAAARQGVDAARVPHGTLAGGVAAAESFARSSASGCLFSPSANHADSSRTVIVITVQGHVPSLVPGLPIKVSQQAEAPVERFTTP